MTGDTDLHVAEGPADPPVPAPPPSRGSGHHPVRWVVAVVGVLLVTVAIVAATRPSVQATAFESPLVGRPAPPLSGHTLSSGSSLNLARYRGHWVVVNFFASWCPPCGQEEPNLVAFAFAQSRRPGGAEMLSVVFHDADASARQFLATDGAQWPAVSDPGGAIANAYGVESPPTTFIIDPRGVVSAAFVGPLTAAQLESAMARARSA